MLTNWKAKKRFFKKKENSFKKKKEKHGYSKRELKSLQRDLRIPCNQVKRLTSLFVAVNKLVLKFFRGTRIARIILKENKVRGLPLSHFGTHL